MNAQWHNACLLAIEQQLIEETNSDPMLFAQSFDDAIRQTDERFETLYQLLLATPAGTA